MSDPDLKDGFTYNMKITKIDFQVFDAEEVANFNKENACGISDWKVGELKDGEKIKNCGSATWLYKAPPITPALFKIANSLLMVKNLDNTWKSCKKIN